MGEFSVAFRFDLMWRFENSTLVNLIIWGYSYISGGISTPWSIACNIFIEESVMIASQGLYLIDSKTRRCCAEYPNALDFLRQLFHLVLRFLLWVSASEEPRALPRQRDLPCLKVGSRIHETSGQLTSSERKIKIYERKGWKSILDMPFLSNSDERNVFQG